MTRGAGWDVGEKLALASEVSDLRWTSILEDDYGVLTGTGVGTSQAQANSAGINQAAAEAGATGVVFCPSNVTVEIYDPIQFGGPVYMPGASFEWVGAASGQTAVLVRSFLGGAQRITESYLWLPHLNGIPAVHTHGAGANTWGTTNGVEICNIDTSHVWLGKVIGFAVGVSITTRNGGSMIYNLFHGNNYFANQTNLWLFSTGTGEAVNENLFIGGSMSWGSGMTAGLAGTYGIRLDHSIAYNAIDNNVFLKTSVEGNPQYLIFLKRAQNNEFIKTRLESNSGLSKVSFGDIALGNRIVPGTASYINNSIVIERVTGNSGAYANVIEGVERIPSGSPAYSTITRLDRADQFSFGPLVPDVVNAGGTFSIDPTTANPGIKAGPGTNPTSAIETMDTSFYRQSAGHWYSPGVIDAATLMQAGAALLVSIAKSGSSALGGAVTLSGGTGISLTQSGQNIDIAATGAASTTFLSAAKWGIN